MTTADVKQLAFKKWNCHPELIQYSAPYVVKMHALPLQRDLQKFGFETTVHDLMRLQLSDTTGLGAG